MMKNLSTNCIKVIIILLIIVSSSINCQTTKEIAKYGINSTVTIIALDKNRQPLSYGSGFIVEQNLIVTNFHVVEGCYSVKIISNDQNSKVDVYNYVALDKKNDLIILKITNKISAPLSLGDNILPDIGERIFSIGNPKGLSGTFSEGIVSGIRNIDDVDIIQITAPISPGSSGGPVINSNNKVIGVAYAGYQDGQNLNFAVPIKYVKKLLVDLEDPKKFTSILGNRASIKKTDTLKNKDGVVFRKFGRDFSFSIKNNLDYPVANIKILFLFYDSSGELIHYHNQTFFGKYEIGSVSQDLSILPRLAKSARINTSFLPSLVLRIGIYEARILDYDIIDE